jgi:SsrA-binding protein
MTDQGDKQGDKRRVLAENRRARHDYEFLDTLECGIALAGTEVKSLRQGKASIAEAFAMVKRGELWLVGAHIPEYAFGNIHNHPPVRDRRLLVHRRELANWESKVREKGVTIVPLSIYFKGSLVKVSIALARGRKLHDKREREREKSDKREIERALSARRR